MSPVSTLYNSSFQKFGQCHSGQWPWRDHLKWNRHCTLVRGIKAAVWPGVVHSPNDEASMISCLLLIKYKSTLPNLWALLSFFFFFNLAVLGLRCGIQTLCCDMWDLVLWSGTEPSPLSWECRLLTTGPPREVPMCYHFMYHLVITLITPNVFSVCVFGFIVASN